jgi:hypothetical protein
MTGQATLSTTNAAASSAGSTGAWMASIREVQGTAQKGDLYLWVGVRNTSNENRVICLPLAIAYSVRGDSGKDFFGISNTGLLSPHSCQGGQGASLVEPGGAAYTLLSIPVEASTPRVHAVRLDIRLVELADRPPFDPQRELQLEWEGAIGRRTESQR